MKKTPNILIPGAWIEVKDPSDHVRYGPFPYQVVKVGRVNVKTTIRFRMSPTGPWFQQEHKIPLSHVVRVLHDRDLVRCDSATCEESK